MGTRKLAWTKLELTPSVGAKRFPPFAQRTPSQPSQLLRTKPWRCDAMRFNGYAPAAETRISLRLVCDDDQSPQGRAVLHCAG